jgi:mycobactin lysine-N-oxygenase
MSRAESFLENRVFSNPDDVDWSSQSIESRRDFVRHSDRGVFDPGTLSEIAYDDRCRFVTGRVTHVASAHDREGVRVHCRSAAGELVEEHDYLVNCTGFDLLEQLRLLLPAAAREELHRRVGGLWDRSPSAEIPIGRNLELEGMRPRLHVPGLAGLSQGPGFANLGSLGILANRVLEPLVLGARPAAERLHEQRSDGGREGVPLEAGVPAVAEDSVAPVFSE